LVLHQDMQLSNQAIKELRKILKNELGDLAEKFSDREIELLGTKLLGVTSTVIKKKAKRFNSANI
jgi:hypothetical protein